MFIVILRDKNLLACHKGEEDIYFDYDKLERENFSGLFEILSNLERKNLKEKLRESGKSLYNLKEFLFF